MHIKILVLLLKSAVFLHIFSLQMTMVLIIFSFSTIPVMMRPGMFTLPVNGHVLSRVRAISCLSLSLEAKSHTLDISEDSSWTSPEELTSCLKRLPVASGKLSQSCGQTVAMLATTRSESPAFNHKTVVVVRRLLEAGVYSRYVFVSKMPVTILLYR